MKFYGREKKLASLTKIADRSQRIAQLTVISGRRRIGKTRLIRESLAGQQFVYLFVTRTEESVLCQQFRSQIESTLAVQMNGEFPRFRQLFAWLCEYATRNHLNLVIDEFQEFFRINGSIYSDMQNIWDTNKEQMRMNLILSGSVQSLMRRIFDNYREPLFGRATAKLFIEPFGVRVLEAILKEYKPDFTSRDLLTLYILTGGVPKYVEYYVDNELLTEEEMIDAFFLDDSFHLNEGKALLVEEFGKDYGTYFTILALMSSGKTDRGALRSVLQKDIGGYLKRLKEDYSIISAHRPLFSKPQTRNVKYFIDDNFLSFWFRYIHKHRGLVELKNYGALKQLIARDYPTYCGRYLEKFIRKQLGESMQYTAVGNYWQRGNQNEIDVIAYNELTRQAVIGEVKMNPERISLEELRQKAAIITPELQGYAIEYRGFSPEDLIEE